MFYAPKDEPLSKEDLEKRLSDRKEGRATQDVKTSIGGILGVYNRLKDGLSKKQNLFFPFVGAGMSHWAGAPGWNALLRIIAQRVEYGDVREEVYQLLDADNAIGAAEIMSRVTGVSFKRQTAELTAGVPIEVEPQRNIGAFQRFRDLVDQHPDWKRRMKYQETIPLLFPNLIVTTNYDFCLEAGCLRDRGYNTVVGTRQVLPVPISGPTLLKLHGTASDPRSMIITETDYDIYYGETAGFVGNSALLLQRLWLDFEYVPVFLGCSLTNDGTIKLFRNRPPREAYAILEMPSGRNYQELERRIHDNIGINLQIIWFPNGQYHYVGLLLRKLAYDCFPQQSRAQNIQPLSPDEENILDEMLSGRWMPIR